MESVGDDLGGGEGTAGLRLPVLLRGPVPLAHHEAQLGGPRLPLTLLNIRPANLNRKILRLQSYQSWSRKHQPDCQYVGNRGKYDWALAL